jgi:cephalosporin hydroxylase
MYDHVDFAGHIDRLRDLARLCDSATEFGVRRGDGSTVALAEGVRKKLRAFDRVACVIPHIETITRERGVDFQFIKADVTRMESIEPCDLLYIDTDHWYGQLKAELELHAPSVRRFIVLHDTVTSWKEDMGREGLGRAIEEFLAANPQWYIKVHYEDWNGLMILENKDAVDLPDVPAA